MKLKILGAKNMNKRILIVLIALAIVIGVVVIYKALPEEPFPEEEMNLLTLDRYSYYSNSKGKFSNVLDWTEETGADRKVKGYIGSCYWTLYRRQNQLDYYSVGSVPYKTRWSAYKLVETKRQYAHPGVKGEESFIWCIVKDGKVVKWGVEGDFVIGKAPYYVRTPDNVEEEMDLQYPMGVEDLIVTKKFDKWPEGNRDIEYSCNIYNPYYFPVNITYHCTYPDFDRELIKEGNFTTIVEPFGGGGRSGWMDYAKGKAIPKVFAETDDIICELLRAERVPFEYINKK